MTKKRLLFISRYPPGPVGGSCLRAWHTLEALQFNYDIHLLLISANPSPQPIPKTARNICSRIIDYSEGRNEILYSIKRKLAIKYSLLTNFVNTAAYSCHLQLSDIHKRQISKEIISGKYDIFHLFKLETSHIIPLITRNCPFAEIHLDLDDIESLRWQRNMELYSSNRDLSNTRFAKTLADAHRELEQRLLPSVDRVYACSQLDKQRLEHAYRLKNIRCLPNVYPPKELGLRLNTETKESATTFCFVWVGSLGYYPNQDSLLFFCREILPLLRERRISPFVVKVIGQGKLPTKILRTLQKLKEINLIGRVDDLDPYYQEANAAIVPLRAGGGTRLKILEAFAYGVPVVSTSIGAEGLEVHHDIHTLIADSPSDFAAQCVRLTNEPALGVRLSENAQALLKEKYSPERLKEILCGQATASPTANRKLRTEN
ncbi:MAG: glycosyltransferase family 4 protein [Thermodesulfobacteriota bacterium]